MYKVIKTFGEYPFAHRQHTHTGHCQYIHGHNWRIRITLCSDQLDENGFVYDFGKFKKLKEWFNHMFDHTLLINEDDPHLDFFKSNTWIDSHMLWDMRIIPSGSAEKLAEYIYAKIPNYVKADNDVYLESIEVFEDAKNVAIYRPKDMLKL